MNDKRRLSTFICLTAILALPVSAARATPIANVEDVVNSATHTPPGANIEPVQKNDGLVQNEQVETKPESAVQMTFVDGSELRLEESSTVVLDNYVFDPKAQASNGLVNLGAGLFRFTSSGKDDQGVILKTAAATIGIRGTDIVVNVQQKGITRVDVLEGRVFLKPLGYGAGSMVEAGQSGLVIDANINAEVGDIGSFATAAGPSSPSPNTDNQSNNDRSGAPGNQRSGGNTSSGNTGGSGGSGGSGGGTGGTGGGGGSGGGSGGDGGSGGGSGDGGSGDGGSGDGGSGDGGSGDGGNSSHSHSGLGDNSNPGKGDDHHQGGNGGSNNPGRK